MKKEVLREMIRIAKKEMLIESRKRVIMPALPNSKYYSEMDYLILEWKNGELVTIGSFTAWKRHKENIIW